MSHPFGISCRHPRTTSRMRRRMRLRTTALPSAFLMLNPKRVCGNSFGRKKTVKWELERRFPARYTVSKSPRRTSRASRGNFNPCAALLEAAPGLATSFGRKAMAPLLAAGRQDLAATLGLHAYAEAVRLGPAALARLICALWQSNPPLSLQSAHFLCDRCRQITSRDCASLRRASAAVQESSSVFDPCAHGQEMRHSTAVNNTF